MPENAPIFQRSRLKSCIHDRDHCPTKGRPKAAKAMPSACNRILQPHLVTASACSEKRSHSEECLRQIRATPAGTSMRTTLGKVERKPCSCYLRSRAAGIFPCTKFRHFCGFGSLSPGVDPKGYPPNRFLAPSRRPLLNRFCSSEILIHLTARRQEISLDFPFRPNLSAGYFRQASVSSRPEHFPTPAASAAAKPAANPAPGQSIRSEAGHQAWL